MMAATTILLENVNDSDTKHIKLETRILSDDVIKRVV